MFNVPLRPLFLWDQFDRNHLNLRLYLLSSMIVKMCCGWWKISSLISTNFSLHALPLQINSVTRSVSVFEVVLYTQVWCFFSITQCFVHSFFVKQNSRHLFIQVFSLKRYSQHRFIKEFSLERFAFVCDSKRESHLASAPTTDETKIECVREDQKGKKEKEKKIKKGK